MKYIKNIKTYLKNYERFVTFFGFQIQFDEFFLKLQLLLLMNVSRKFTKKFD